MVGNDGGYGMWQSVHVQLMNIRLAFHGKEMIFIVSGVRCSVCIVNGVVCSWHMM